MSQSQENLWMDGKTEGRTDRWTDAISEGLSGRGGVQKACSHNLGINDASLNLESLDHVS